MLTRQQGVALSCGRSRQVILAVAQKPLPHGSRRVGAGAAAVMEAPTDLSNRKPVDGPIDLSVAPPFSIQDVRNAIPDHLWEKNTARSMLSLVVDVAVVLGMAAVAYTVNQWWLWPLYWAAQGTMFWAIFVVGHDCGHGSFSNNKTLNDLIGNITHSSILVPYHGWRISHRNHHANHGHVENDESWYPASKSLYDKMDPIARMGRLTLPWSLFAFPFYLWRRSPGKEGSHFDPNCDLFTKAEGAMVQTSNAFLIGMLGVLAACTYALGPVSMACLYLVPYWVGVVWLDVVTYLQHHGPEDPSMKMPWYRGEEWSYFRGAMSTLDHDYGIFNEIHHNIGTHFVHHLFPQIAHCNLVAATEAIKPVVGPYYREPAKSGWFPTHLIAPLVKSFKHDHYVDDTGNVLYYKEDPNFSNAKAK